jgi:hypothetical protein
MRNAVAATTTPERLEPDPARACPAPAQKMESGEFVRSSIVRGMETSKETRGTEMSSAEGVQGGESPVMIARLGKKRGGVLRVPVCVKSTESQSKRDVERNATEQTNRRSVGSSAPLESSDVNARQLPTAGNASRPETHVFADHRDLVNFLRDEFPKHCRGG